MIRCKECKYWNKDTWMCSCDKFIYGGDYGLGLVCTLDFHRNEEKFQDMLIYEDYECYSANFVVGPNFGCIHGVKK